MMRLALTTALAIVAASLLATAGAAREDASTAFTCPQSTSTALFVQRYPATGRVRGSTWCNDGATATLTLKADPPTSLVPTSLRFVGGVCTQSRSGTRYVQIGTRISPANNRKPLDPKGFFLNKPKTNAGNWLELGMPTFNREDYVAIAWSGLKGTFSGTSDVTIGKAVRKLTVKGAFVCRRIVKTR